MCIFRTHHVFSFFLLKWTCHLTLSVILHSLKLAIHMAIFSQQQPLKIHWELNMWLKMVSWNQEIYHSWVMLITWIWSIWAINWQLQYQLCKDPEKLWLFCQTHWDIYTGSDQGIFVRISMRSVKASVFGQLELWYDW